MEAQEQNHRQIGIGVVGCGQWGINHVRKLFKLGYLRAVVDVSISALQALDLELNLRSAGVLLGTDLHKDLLDRLDVQAVVVAVPSSFHYPVAKAALEKGKHALVEKVMCLEEEHAADLIKLASDRRLVLMTGHIVLYDPVFIHMITLLERGLVGDIRHVYATRLSLGKFRTDENVLYSFAPHDIAMILRIIACTRPDSMKINQDVTEDVVEVVGASASCSSKEKQANFGTISLESKDRDIHAQITVSWIHPYKERKLVVFGDQGVLVYDALNATPERQLMHYNVGSRVSTDGAVEIISSAASKSAMDPTVQGDALETELQHFVNCITTPGTLPISDGKQGLAVLRILKKSDALIKYRKDHRVDDALVKAVGSGNEPSPVGKEHQQSTPAPFFLHPSSILDAGAVVGNGTKIWHFCHVMGAAQIGNGCNIGQNVYVGNVKIGNNVKIQNNVSIYDGVEIEDDVFLGPSMVFTNIKNPRSSIVRRGEYARTVVKRGSTIGANATIVCGVTLGCNSFVGAGAVVTKDVPAYTMVYGNPAVVHGYVSPLGYPLDEVERIAGTGDLLLKCKQTSRMYIYSDKQQTMIEK